MKWALFFLLLPLISFAGPSADSCDFYQDLENEFRCGPQGYLQEFGLPLCLRYLKGESALQSNHLAYWLDDVRYCLQKELDVQKPHLKNCSVLKKTALDSHLTCYKQTGFCNLNLIERTQVLEMTSWRVFTPEVMNLIQRALSLCPLI